MEGHKILKEGLDNWKLRLILSAVLCIMGLAALVSMTIGLFINLSVYDKSIVAIAIWMVGIPIYLIISGVAKITPQSVAKFINESNQEIQEDLQILLADESELNDYTRTQQKKLIQLFNEQPVHTFLPDKPVKQAYFLMVFSMISCFGIWFVS